MQPPWTKPSMGFFHSGYRPKRGECSGFSGPAQRSSPAWPPCCPAAVAVAFLLLVAVLPPAFSADPAPERASNESEAALEERLRSHVSWLADPAREGRGPGSDGLAAAASWVVEQFAEISRLDAEQSRRQPFTMALEARLVESGPNHAELVGPAGETGQPVVIPLELGRDFTPLAAGGSGAFDLPLVFAGYGITAPAEKYDDYAALSAGHGVPSPAKGAAVIVLRQEPQKDNPHSVFNGNQASQHAALVRKIANAAEHDAGAVVFCNDGGSEEPDRLMDFRRAGDGSTGRSLPILQIRRGLIATVVERALGRPLPELEKEIDDTLEPRSGLLPGWRLRGEVAIERRETEASNIVAVLPGTGVTRTSGTTARDVVVLGAHYDHLGYGDGNSLAPGVEAIHHGADDNASGTAMLIEVARLLAAEGPFPRTILFVAFAGEERGLLGSAHYTANPLLPLDRTAAMVNLDMVGRLDGEKLIVHGTGTGTGFDPLVDRLAAAAGLATAKEPGGFGPSDHSSFYARKIPVLHLFTGSHTDYHRPTDTADKINYLGMARITRVVAELVRELATAAQPPDYVEVASPQFAGGGGDRPYFGSIPDFGKPGGGYALSGVSKDSPAARGGLRGGDLIVRLGESTITGLEDFDSALRKHRAGETVDVVVRRDGRDVTLQVKLGDPR
jgi:hypothetical protein